MHLLTILISGRIGRPSQSLTGQSKIGSQLIISWKREFKTPIDPLEPPLALSVTTKQWENSWLASHQALGISG
jgi:hypothetical protein